jgi:hypothetical protein
MKRIFLTIAIDYDSDLKPVFNGVSFESRSIDIQTVKVEFTGNNLVAVRAIDNPETDKLCQPH